MLEAARRASMSWRTGLQVGIGLGEDQVENQINLIYRKFSELRLRFASLKELNGWLEAECRRWIESNLHSDHGGLTFGHAWEAKKLLKKALLQPVLARFSGLHESEHAVRGTCLISFD